MKAIYYLFSVKDAYFTDLSKILKYKKTIDTFYGLACGRTPVLEDPLYTQISYISDLIKKKEEEVDIAFLETIESTYDICLSEIIHVDRQLMRLNKKKRYYVAQEMIKLFIEETTRYKISVVFVEAIDDFMSFFANIYCHYQGIKYLCLADTCIDLGTFFTDRLDLGPKNLEQKFEEALCLIKQGPINALDIKRKLTAYIDAKKRPVYCTDITLLYKTFAWSDIKRFFNYLYLCIKDKHGMNNDVHPLSLPYLRCRRIIRRLRYSRFLKKNQITLLQAKQMKYLIYPLHVEPEASTLVLGRWFNDQKRIIEMISKNLPAGYSLIIKEHHGALGKRALSFYKEVNHYHNVYYVADTIDSYELIRYSAGVVVISSTMAVEAMMMNKPVLCFGDKFYNISKNVYKARDFSMLRNSLDQLLHHQFDEHDILALFYLLSKEGKDLGYGSPTNYQDKHLEKIAIEVGMVINE